MESFSALLHFVRGIHRPSVNSPHKGQWRGALMFPLICARINGRVNSHEADELRRHRAHYDITVMITKKPKDGFLSNVKQHFISTMMKISDSNCHWWKVHASVNRNPMFPKSPSGVPLSWWRHQMETFSALLALCAVNSPVPVSSPHKGQWRGALMFSLISVWINGWVNNREAGDLRRHRGHYDVTVMSRCCLGLNQITWFHSWFN